MHKEVKAAGSNLACGALGAPHARRNRLRKGIQEPIAHIQGVELPVFFFFAGARHRFS